MLGAGFGQLVLHQLGVHGQCGERVEFLVCLGEVTPGAVVVKTKVMGEVPREWDVLEMCQRKDHGVARHWCQAREYVFAVVRPRGAGGLIEVCGRGRRWPAAEYLHPGSQQVVGSIPSEEFTPVVCRPPRLVAGVEIGCLLCPVDRKVGLADFL